MTQLEARAKAIMRFDWNQPTQERGFEVYETQVGHNRVYVLGSVGVNKAIEHSFITRQHKPGIYEVVPGKELQKPTLIALAYTAFHGMVHSSGYVVATASPGQARAFTELGMVEAGATRDGKEIVMHGKLGEFAGSSAHELRSSNLQARAIDSEH